MIALNVVIPPFTGIDASTFLRIYKATWKCHIGLQNSKRKYDNFCDKMQYYGTHPTAPIKIDLCEGIFDIMAKFQQAEFIDCNLTKDDEKKVAEFIQKRKGDMAQMIADICAEDLKISIGFYPEHESFAVFLNPTDNNRKNKGKLLSAWSDDPVEAVFLAGYKHFEKFESGTWSSTEKKARWG